MRIWAEILHKFFNVYNPGKVVDNVGKLTQVARAHCFVALFFLRAYLFLAVSDGQGKQVFELILNKLVGFSPSASQSMHQLNMELQISFGLCSVFPRYVSGMSLVCLRVPSACF